jgi:GNAT superfamily N-acetyltransferase
MEFIGPSSSFTGDCERILRSLPEWFGIEESLLEYVADTKRFPTFVAVEQEPVAFVTVREHFPKSWEVHCVAVHAQRRNAGVGRALHMHVESWLAAQGASVLQVKTLSASHPSPEYAQTREFYAHMGYLPLEEFKELWGPIHPVLQLVKWLGPSQSAA